MVSRYRATFETYLTEEVGPLFNPPIRFEAVEVSGIKDVISNKSFVDFALFDAKSMACVMMAGGSLSPLATRCRDVGGGLCSDELGATIFVRHDNDAINSTIDLRDKKIGIYKTTYFQSFQIPNYEILQDTGLVLFADAAQIVTRTSSTNAYREVIDGSLDAAFVSQGKLESLERSGRANLSLVKVLHPRTTTSSGAPSPLLLSTETYPEFTLSYSGRFSQGNMEVVRKVTNAIFDLNATHSAAVSGGYLRWNLPSPAISETRDLLEDLGFVPIDARTKQRKCVGQRSNMYDGIRCPSGYFLALETTVSKQCREQNISCPSGRECICRPCKKSHAVNIFAGIPSVIPIRDGMISSLPCSKMKLQPVRMTVFDNKYTGKQLRYSLKMVSTLDGYPLVGTVNASSNFTYEFKIAGREVGISALEIFLGGEQVESSPTLIRIEPRLCNEGEVATVFGECMSKTDHYIPSWMSAIILSLFFISFAICLLLAAWTYTFRQSAIVTASQKSFLYLICIGTAISLTSILMFQFDDNPDPASTFPTVTEESLDTLCVASFWAYGIGFCLTIAAIYAKLLRAKNLTLDTLDKSKLRRKASNREPSQNNMTHYFMLIFKSLATEALLLTIWTVVDPPTWEREWNPCYTEQIRVLRNASKLLDFLPIVYLQVRLVPEEFAEHKWITAACMSSLEVHLVASLVLALTWYSKSKPLIMALLVFFNALPVLLMIFIPKMRAHHFEVYNDNTYTVEDALHNMRKKVRNFESKSTLSSSKDSKRKRSGQSSENSGVFSRNRRNEGKSMVQLSSSLSPNTRHKMFGSDLSSAVGSSNHSRQQTNTTSIEVTTTRVMFGSDISSVLGRPTHFRQQTYNSAVRIERDKASV
eukprot:jgi/Bigna1/85275/estExt_fgenesh1_pg.C_30124